MQVINLDLSVKGIIPLLQAKQGDVGRKFQAVITDGGNAYEIPDGTTLSVWYSGTSGEGNYSHIGLDDDFLRSRSAFAISGNTVTVELVAQMLACPGGGTMCLVMNSAEGDQIATWNIPYIVEKIPGANSEGATQYYTAYAEAAMIPMSAALARAEQAALKAEAAQMSKLISRKIRAITEAELDAALQDQINRMPDGGLTFIEVQGPVYMREDFSGFADENTVITDEPTVKGAGGANWNGATPSSNWSPYINSGSVILQPHIEENGNVCIKMTPVDSGRAQLRYFVPSDIYDLLMDGETYRVSVRYKGEGSDFKAQLEAKASEHYPIVKFDLVDGKWITGTYDFTVDKSYGSLILTFGIAYPGGTQGALYIDDICLEKVVDAKLFDGKNAIGQVYRADGNHAVVSLATYGETGNQRYEKTLCDGVWLPMKYSDGTDADHNHDGYALADHNHDGSYLPKNTAPADIGAMAKVGPYYYAESDNTEENFNAWLDEQLATMAVGEARPIRFSVHPAIDGATFNGFLLYHNYGYGELIATSYAEVLLHKKKYGSNGWSDALKMGLIHGTPATANHDHDNRYYQPDGATVLTNQNWNQYISTSGGESAGMAREFDSGYLYEGQFDSAKCPGGSFTQDDRYQYFSFNKNMAKFYTIMLSTDTDYLDDDTGEGDVWPASGSIGSASVDYMAIQNVINTRKYYVQQAECEVWVPTANSAPVMVTITISGTEVTFKAPLSQCRFVNICGYY